MTLAIISISSTLILGILSAIFKVGAKLRLTLPILYFLAAATSTFITRWTTENEALVLAGLYILIVLVLVSWIVSLIKVIRNRRYHKQQEDDMVWQIKRAKELGILSSSDTVRFNAQGDLINPQTGEPVIFGKGVVFRDF